MDVGRGKIIGKWGEDQACAFLIRHGFFVKERNFFSTVGELDIIAEKGGDYYFVEVKTRAEGDLASDLAITQAKKHKLEKTVRKYCYQRNIEETGIMLAGLLVVYNRFLQKTSFRFVVFS
ncbi:MAG: YraN family protein [Candidatus Magasanikbacteria bacterium]